MSVSMIITRHRLVTCILLTIFWVLGTYNFVLQEFGRAEYPPVETAGRIMGQLVLMGMGLALLRNKMDLLIIAVFCLFTFIGTWWVNEQSIFSWFDGLRQYVGFLFVIPIIRWLWTDKARRDDFVHSMERTLFIFLWLQLPCMLIQVVQYYDLDKVGGSLGWGMSGVISTLIYIISFYLMLRQWDKSKGYLENLKANRQLLFLLFPTMLNETKISFLYLMLYFLFLIPMDRNFIKRLIWMLPIGVVVLCGAGYMYLSVVNHSGLANITVESYLIGDENALQLVEYVMENDAGDIAESDFARGLKLGVTPAIMERKPSAWIWGFGLGQYKVNDSAKGLEFATRYAWLLGGTVIQVHYIWLEAGLGGVAFYIIFWLLAFRAFRKGVSRKGQLQWMLGLVAVLFSVYNAPMLVVPFIIVFIFLVFVSSRWGSLPPYKKISILGSRKIVFTLRDKDGAEE